ncbi:Homoserine dehydrogenase [Desulfitobacterium hafniense]|uniref:Homoserine dehydrogenase n=1 Tax=Desulfitobacterium hafniense TaxID=49338 RepID=A0A098B733_DESHA|nr:homoserine dehydrogenase [Desulfitobacterium hafniense]CDX04200.1 Homoserine dehydrogenase [Desulfitobacterium hafniense]
MQGNIVKIGLLGCGNVGQGVVKGIELHSNKILCKLGVTLVVSKALVQDISKERTIGGVVLTQQPQDILDDPEIEVIVEVMGGEYPAYFYLKEALAKGKHVVTANKLLLALHGTELQAIARRKGTCLLYEGSVLGGIPILRTIQHGLAGDQVKRIRGILNGTTNYILTQMVESGKGYEEALQEAQEAGYAESDPTMDVTGLDAACKLVILCRECFELEIPLEEVEIKGIQGLTGEEVAEQKRQGRVPKLVAEASVVEKSSSGPEKRREGIIAKVGVQWLSGEAILSHVSGVDNGLSLETQLAGELFWKGPGAGGLATGGAVLSDIVEIAKKVVIERSIGNAAR